MKTMYKIYIVKHGEGYKSSRMLPRVCCIHGRGLKQQESIAIVDIMDSLMQTHGRYLHRENSAQHNPMQIIMCVSHVVVTCLERKINGCLPISQPQIIFYRI